MALQQDQMLLKKQLEEANEKIILAEESFHNVSTSLPASLTKVTIYYSARETYYFYKYSSLHTIYKSFKRGKFSFL